MKKKLFLLITLGIIAGIGLAHRIPGDTTYSPKQVLSAQTSAKKTNYNCRSYSSTWSTGDN